MGLRLGAIDLGLGRAAELRVARVQSLGLRLGFLRLGAIDLGLGRADELSVSRVESLGFRLGFKVRSGRFRVRAGL